MVLDLALHLTVLLLLGLALGVFLVRLGVDVRRREPVADFGAAFAAFLAAWVGLELVEAFAPVSWAGAEEVAHFGLLAAFAAWMNLRWRWALRQAQEGAS